MIAFYFESNGSSELMGYTQDESVYKAVYPYLEASFAKDNGVLTEREIGAQLEPASDMSVYYLKKEESIDILMAYKDTPKSELSILLNKAFGDKGIVKMFRHPVSISVLDQVRAE
ncbi:hypothetical protein A3715_19955 [Oleiphilus sp. HI0009]|nr:hypothetical protein A3715_15260 [Oleiphilus sp. HI0009]KZX78637.1 hypothetical protein A3715_19955 [Oleiphilus sp. HI0009]